MKPGAIKTKPACAGFYISSSPAMPTVSRDRSSTCCSPMTALIVKRFTIAEYHRLGELGFFGEDDRVELIRGEIVEMSPKGTPHETCIRRLLRQLSKLLGDRATLQSQAPII